MPATGGGKGKGRARAAAKPPVAATPNLQHTVYDDIESACGEEQEFAVDDETATRGVKRPYASTSDLIGGEMQDLLTSFGADMSRSLQAKRSRMENYTQAALKTSSKKVKELWQTHHSERAKLNGEYDKQITAVFTQWESDLQKTKEAEEKLQSMFKQQQKLFQQQRVVLSQRMKTIRQIQEQYMKSMDELDSHHEQQTANMHTELKKEMAALQKKILTDTHNQELSTVRRSLKNMLEQCS